MTLDALFQLMKIISPSDTPSDGDIANFMTMLIATKNHSDALLPFSQRVYMLSVAHSDPKNAAALLSSCQPEAVSPLPLLNFSGWPDVRYATSGELQTPESEEYFTRFRLPPRYYARQSLTLNNRKTRQHFIFWIRCLT